MVATPGKHTGNLMKKSWLGLVVTAFVLMIAGCATSNSVMVNPGTTLQVRSAYVVLHQGNSSDMDAHIQRELMAHGVQVTAGPEMQHPDADVIVRYSDNWKWDMAMYLRSLDIQMYDTSSGGLVATASWKNSAMHGFHSADGVVKNVIDQIFVKLNRHT